MNLGADVDQLNDMMFGISQLANKGADRDWWALRIVRLWRKQNGSNFARFHR